MKGEAKESAFTDPGYYVRLFAGWARLQIDPKTGLPPTEDPAECVYDTEGVSEWTPLFWGGDSPVPLLVQMNLQILAEWFEGDADRFIASLEDFQEAVRLIEFDRETMTVRKGDGDGPA